MAVKFTLNDEAAAAVGKFLRVIDARLRAEWAQNLNGCQRRFASEAEYVAYRSLHLGEPMPRTF